MAILEIRSPKGVCSGCTSPRCVQPEGAPVDQLGMPGGGCPLESGPSKLADNSNVSCYAFARAAATWMDSNPSQRMHCFAPLAGRQGIGRPCITFHLAIAVMIMSSQHYIWCRILSYRFGTWRPSSTILSLTAKARH